ncbi:hypothetical protein GO003_008565 [Methylicorpusculum oleiharenae]|uniref:hypothetical protein n=1 Tax=Methylicorpusculum oleiharenae TaxID=1338687 RepID=UPI00135AC996|nr:hypothetical protein [Methylicorpusculum oleiharenae]MCD2450438.1 hypothetical protein [Methylicorpusculum oleiharenae]
MTQPINLASERLWRAIPDTRRKVILQSVWCSQCRGSTTIIDYAVLANGVDILLDGKCHTCGAQVRRVLD